MAAHGSAERVIPIEDDGESATSQNTRKLPDWLTTLQSGLIGIGCFGLLILVSVLGVKINPKEVMPARPLFPLGRAENSTERYVDYLRIMNTTVQPKPKYDAIEWLRTRSAELGLAFNYKKFPEPGKFAAWLTWRGSRPDLKSILLRSTMEVMGQKTAKTLWTYKYGPFETGKENNSNTNNILGGHDLMSRSTTAGHLQAIQNLQKEGFVPIRTLQLLVLPDTEISMKRFVKSAEFHKLNLGFVLEESEQSSTESAVFTNGGRGIWRFKVRAQRNRLLANDTTAEDKVQLVINKLLNYRNAQRALLDKDPSLQESDLSSINLRQIGENHSYIPPEIWAMFELRVRQRADIQKLLDDGLAEAGPRVSIQFYQKTEFSETVLNQQNLWWNQLKRTYAEMNWKYETQFLADRADASYVREAGIPVLGHSLPIVTNESTFGQTTGRYQAIIKTLTSYIQ